MVLPGDELTVKLRHIGMRDGNIVNIETFNAQGEKVIQAQLKFLSQATVFVFTGQGSQEPSMRMDLYNSSPAACSIKITCTTICQ